MGNSGSKTSSSETVCSRNVLNSDVYVESSKQNIDDNIPKIIVGIDFGTTFTGFAYSFSKDKNNIITARHVLGDDRVPTVLLLNHDGTFNSFGRQAEDEYARLSTEDVNYKEYRLFERFKMALYTQNKLVESMEINDQEGRPMKALDVFSIIIKHLKEVIIQSIKEGKTGSLDQIDGNILWMLSIPAISSDSARQFMRLAASNSGINEKDMRLVLEPEAASLSCLEKLLKVNDCAEVEKLPPGTKYIIADIGGGTADICAHEIIQNGGIRELYRATGGPFGGLSVNNAFIQYLIKICGSDIWFNFQRNSYSDNLEFMRQFEEKKRHFQDKHKETKVIVSLPGKLVRSLEKQTHQTLECIVAQTTFASEVKVKEDKLILDKSIMKEFFKPSIDGIVSTLTEIMKQLNDKGITLIVVGGYAESVYLRDVLKGVFGSVNFVLAEKPRVAVLEGTVLMGFKPQNIIQRKARFTYGFGVIRPFLKGIHPDELRFERDGKDFCDNIFSKVIEKDCILTFDQRFVDTTTNTLKLPASKRLVLCTPLYKSLRKNPQYTNDTEECTMIAEITKHPPETGWPDKVEFDNIVTVGETEFKFECIDKSTGRKYETDVDFL